uniref:Uncharacterized protein LOC104225791 n=1 Tax=Nicotiana sylvestris TaxID=4096 RepID=A0A1U7WMR3_NICSY|nr:PREDICTED: uncharacterized protein LOC104225791 [Nicotiana sylvestris]
MKNENNVTASETDPTSPTFNNPQTDFVLPLSHPFYLHPSDNPGTILVTKQFNGDCFGAWRRGIIIVLGAKKKLGFINGSYVQPSPGSPLFEHWEQCNNMILTWILNSLDPDISQSVIYSKSAKSLWDEVNQRYGQANGAKMYEVQKDLSTISQGSSDVGSYFTRVKRLWNEMESLDIDSFCVCDCKCGGKHKIIKKMKNQKLMQFLMGLNEVFNNARGNILMMQPLPEVSNVYSLVVQDEKQRGIHNVPGFQSDSAAFSARSNGPTYNPKPPQTTNFTQRYTFNNPNPANQSFNNQKGGYDPKRHYCRNCKKPGHVIEKCYKLHEFSQLSKAGNKNIRVVVPVHSSPDAKAD